MAIDYSLVGWDPTKYFGPTNMNHMDDGIKAACDGVDKLTTEVAVTNESLTNMTVLSGGTDLNTVVAKNDYTGNALVNIPEEVPSYAWCNISVRPFANADNYICQTLTTSVLNKEFMRVCHNGVWSEWDSHALNSDLNALKPIASGRLYFDNLAQSEQVQTVTFETGYDKGYQIILTPYYDNGSPQYWSYCHFFAHNATANGFQVSGFCNEGTCSAISVTYVAIPI